MTYVNNIGINLEPSIGIRMWLLSFESDKKRKQTLGKGLERTNNVSKETFILLIMEQLNKGIRFNMALIYGTLFCKDFWKTLSPPFFT